MHKKYKLEDENIYFLSWKVQRFTMKIKVDYLIGQVIINNFNTF